ncbi:hypothetical protein LRAMOSA09568 [Lichtheimia ramosa]|uniref:Protein kinase domain-containing protein n=1 Tax=Lichtheimia ramosa TaxID=688394 RepID=A0A077WI99_9FUNG|nr:hypothetical protein LRAMOSA09568 [Lichtheimia ramosa]
MPTPGSSQVEYEFLDKIGDGAFGQVYRAKHRRSCQVVAVKTVKHRSSQGVEEVTDYSLREYKTLRLLTRHPNIVQLHQSFVASTDELHLVMEYIDGGNLYEYIQHRRHIRIPLEHYEIRRLFRQIMQALAHIHSENIFHRDLKPENILISSAAHEYPIIKLADFGLARRIDSREPYTEYVSTRWYRAPEVLLRSQHYSAPVDLWAAGSIFAELMMLSPLFPGNSQIDQIHRICNILGSPGTRPLVRRASTRPERSSPGFARKSVSTSIRSPSASENQWREGVRLAQRIGFIFPDIAPKPLQSVIPSASASMVDLLQKLLYYDPNRRLQASQALEHSFFQEDKRPRVYDHVERDPLKRARVDINAIDLLSTPRMPLELCSDGEERYVPRRTDSGFHLDAVMHYDKQLSSWTTQDEKAVDQFHKPDEEDYTRLNGWHWLKVL